MVRYRVDAGMWLGGVSPYAVSPGKFAESRPEKVDGVDRTVPHSRVTSVYPPVAQGMFVVGRWIEKRIAGPPGATAPRWRDALRQLSAVHRGILRPGRSGPERVRIPSRGGGRGIDHPGTAGSAWTRTT